MASATSPCRMPMALLLISLSLLIPSTLEAGVICENLPVDLCAFAVSETSQRCVLEKYRNKGGATSEYQCRTSEVVAESISNWIESEQCVKECGVEHNMVGISSDALLDGGQYFAASLCSAACYNNCPNVIDLYFNLADAEGTSLPDLCAARRVNPRRALSELLISSGAAVGPAAANNVAGKLDVWNAAAAAPEASPPAFA